MKKIWIATYVDQGETCDGKARVLKACATKEEAQNEVRADIEQWADNHAGENIEVDFSKMSAFRKDNSSRCDWNIEEVDLPA